MGLPSAVTAAPQPGPDPCGLLTAAEVGSALGESVTASAADLPAGIGGRQCTWAGADGRVLAVETRVNADLDPALRAQGETAKSVLDQTVATQAETITPVTGLGTEAFSGRSHVYVAAATGTVVLDDGAGLSAAAEVALARQAAAGL